MTGVVLGVVAFIFVLNAIGAQVATRDEVKLMNTYSGHNAFE